MIWIVYQGLGGLLFLFILAGVLVGGWLGEALHLARWQTIAIGVVVMSALSIVCGFWLNSGKRDRTLVDQATGEVVKIGQRHSLYHIRLEYWGFIILALGMFMLFQEIQSGSIKLGFS